VSECADRYKLATLSFKEIQDSEPHFVLIFTDMYWKFHC
jgi:hypothetical protein